MAKFSERLWKTVEPVWRSYLQHPFVKGIGDGSLDKEKFKHYMKQDYIYLIEYSRIFALGAAKANDLETMTAFANLLHGTLTVEMDLHREYAAELGISNEELENTEPAASMTSYTSYMLNKSQLGGVENAAASVLACAWSYQFIGESLAAIPGATEHEFYGKWVKMYSSQQFKELTLQCIDLIDKMAEGKSDSDLAILEDIVVKTSYFEYMFWEMAENKEMWPVAATADYATTR
ncbi:thiaminase II [Aciduricibacillus chroicocephali]|uniref:Aminopyrimidine aminohydrolase n=1 Tax=Aciduricibacillus chroicocephali TaxID=3054939 RepID=A0ABY9KTF2_9BACI|nr:thiaminase II [Bacillaceae bacterium 44XB]